MKPQPPFKSLGHCRKAYLKIWGLEDSEKFQSPVKFPCPACEGTGKVDGQPCTVRWCKDGVAPRWVFEPMYRQMLANYRKAEQRYRRMMEMYWNIRRKLTGAEKIFIRLKESPAISRKKKSE